MNARQATKRAAATALALAALAACSGPAGTTTVTSHISPTSSSSPSPSPTATPEPPVDGALPVPAYPASAIPWDEVGDGWFLLTYDPESMSDIWPELPEEGMGEYPELDDSVMLVAPTGDLYYVRSLVGVGNGTPIEWTGDELTILDGQFFRDSDDTPHGPLLTLDLVSGAASIVNPLAYYPDVGRTLPDGRIVTQWGGEGSMWVQVLAPDLTEIATLCGADIDGVATSLDPAGNRVVCLLDGDGGGADVTLHTLTGDSATVIDHFTYDPWNYQTVGWWDDDSFVLMRWTDSGDPLMWTYNVVTRKLSDLNPTLSDGTPAENVRAGGGYRILTTGDVTEIVGFDGTLRASLPCSPSAISGHRALAACWDWEATSSPMEIIVANLETGTLTTVASFVTGESHDLRVYPAPGGETTW